MKKLALSVSAAAAAFAMAPAANAAPTITIVGNGGTFMNMSVTCATATTPTPCSFSDTLTFNTPAGYNLTSATITSSQVGTDTTTNLDFTSVTLNGVQFNVGSTGLVEFRSLLNQPLSANPNTLVITGLTGGAANYTGQLVFTQAAAVPEPAAWLLMILGFGVVGYALRRRPTVRFAY